MTRDDLAGDEESVGDDGLPAELRAAINGCLASSISGEVVVKPTVFVSKNAKQAVMDAFELVGGVPRLAHYAGRAARPGDARSGTSAPCTRGAGAPD